MEAAGVAGVAAASSIVACERVPVDSSMARCLLVVVALFVEGVAEEFVGSSAVSAMPRGIRNNGF